MTTITIDRAVVQQALEALESCQDGDYTTGDVLRQSFDEQAVSAAIVALWAALAQEQAEPVQEAHRDLRAALQAPGCERLREWVEIGPVQRAALETCVAALAQEQAEPNHETRAELAEQQVVQLAEERDHYRNLWQKAQQAEPAQEPVAWADKISFEHAMKTGKGHDVWPKAGDYEARTGRALIGIYTAPPQRVPLTEDEAWSLVEQDYRMEEYGDAAMELIRRTERAHGIGGQDE